MCHCGLPQPFADCCGRFVSRAIDAPDAQSLMRSRYSAFCEQAIDYLCFTCSDKALEQNPREEVAEFAQAAHFVRLHIMDYEPGDALAYVEFKAFYIIADTLHCIHERSQFIQQHHQWKYDSGQLFEAADVKLKRNDPCPCLSGNKFKKCCMS